MCVLFVVVVCLTTVPSSLPTHPPLQRAALELPLLVCEFVYGVILQGGVFVCVRE